MGEAATFYSDLTIVTSDNPRLEDPLVIIAEIEKGIDSNKIKKADSAHLFEHRDTHYYTVIPDRRKAIETAIMEAEREDIVLIAGKGHEDYQILGTKKISFDDRIVAAQALELRSKK
jgi:UDP-N-acetylmuramoyl-L-alanyl-D-glutamate--2,6-diaminopimelate ligase